MRRICQVMLGLLLAVCCGCRGGRLLAPAPVGTAAAAPPLWALQPPRPQPLPAVAEAGWCRDPIDRFVLARLDEKGLQPSPPADPATLLRRTALVLTGLPPSADAVAAFTAEPTDAAFARAIDLLLATPAYGERMAADWLDLARFADTYGYQADFDCRTWPWRDWVISAFNSDMQYDRFATEQLAGDLLPDASVSSRLATAFCRLHRQTNEGGSIDAEWRQEYIADRVDTFGTAFLGLTLGCARCHDHKFDPISQRDYYALGSFFAIDDSGLYPYSTGAVPRPSLRLASAEQELELARLRAGVAAAEQQLLAVRERSAAGAAAWLASTPLPDVPPPLAHYPFDLLAAGKTEDSCRQDQPAAVAAGVTACAGLAGGAVQFDGDGGVTVPGLPAFSRDDAFSLTFALWCPDHKERAVVLHTSQYTEDADTQGYQVLLQDGRLCWQIVHYWPGAAIALRTCAELPLQRWVRVAVSYDGSSRADGMAVYLDGLRVATEVERDGLDGAATVRTLQLGARDRDRGLQGGRLDELAVWDRCLCAFEVCEQQQRAAGVPTPRLADPEAQREFYLAVIDPEMRAARADLRAARAALHGCADAIPEIMVMAAHPLPPPRYVLKRGAYDQPDPSQPVQPDVPAAVMPFGARPRDRAGLAAWLCGARQPLFARVATNRLWALCFGRGLVATPENFGRLGEPPSHPELLDQLACDFIAADYHCKSLLRRIVLSATFRQQSGCSSALRERDPDNRLLARGPSFRLPAETLRDQALLAAGLLHQQVGGPSAKPWQPPGLWQEAGAGWSGADYVPDTGPAAHRRSLYTYRKRTAPPPDMTALDAGSREYCLARRQTTNTPLQPLVFLDDPVFVECARALARRAAADGGTADGERLVVRAFALLVARPPRAGEREPLCTLFHSQSAAFAVDPAACTAACGGAGDATLAALTVVCSMLLGSDQAVTLR